MKITKPLVSVDWLYSNLEHENLIILDCTIPKVTANTAILEEKEQIKGAIFFDIKNVFSDKNAQFPNTVLSPKEFEDKAQNLGINNDSIIVCYDNLGIYSSARVWWMFQLMGFTNIAVLNGGLPAWRAKKFPVEIAKTNQLKKGDFEINYKPEKIKYTQNILDSLENKDVLIIDARSKGRFYGTQPEPRKGLKSGHIPNSVNLPFEEVLEDGKMKSIAELKHIFSSFKNKKQLIFTCGSGITASILILAATISNIKNCAVYDGSWTEWASTENLPIQQ